MSSTPKPHPSVQRVNSAYVQVPHSPVSLASYRALGISAHVVPSSRLKENTPLSPFRPPMAQHASSSLSTKRKLSERDSSSLVFDGVHISSSKKPRLSTASANMSSLKALKSTGPAANATAEFLNGYVYCHQCNKKRDVSATLRCTVVEQYHTAKDKTIRERRCVNKYCKPCLKNRYNEDIDVLKSQTPRKITSSRFKCPRCMGTCNCPRCRKLQGLEAIGNISKTKQRELSSTSKSAKKSKAEAVKGAAKENPKQKLKPLPALKWTPVPVRLAQDEAEERIFIREFVLRFSDSLDPIIANTYLDELERIGGSSRTHDEDEEPVGWVSEICVKAIISGLLGLLAKDHDNDISRLIKATAKDLKSVGVNLNKIWAALSTLRTDITNVTSSEGFNSSSAISDTETPLTYPDPSPPPLVAQTRLLRSLRQSETSISIVNSTQMIPVVISLIHSALETVLIREDIDRSTKEIKDFVRDAKEATRIENERWDKVRPTMEATPKDKLQREENRIKRNTHKDQIANIENCLKIISKSFVPRFTTLGTDDEGRVYYALSPGAAEREAAFEYLEVASNEKPIKPKKKSRLLSADDQQEMREWSWFVAVWGKRSPLSVEEQADLDNNSDCDAEDEDDVTREKWWGFCEPQEITKVAQYISIKSGLEDESDAPLNQHGSLSNPKVTHSKKEKIYMPLSPHQEQTKRLVTELKEYASLLEWRMREDKCMLVNRFAAPDGKGKVKTSSAAIPVEKFYQ